MRNDCNAGTARRLIMTVACFCVGAATIGASSPRPSQRGLWAAQSDPWIYVADSFTDAVRAYDIEAAGTPLVRTIHTGVHAPSALALDAVGTLYVANQKTITVYPEGATAPKLTLDYPDVFGLAVAHPSLDLYAITRASPPTLYVFHQHQKTPYMQVQSALFKDPAQLMFDAADNLYIADNDSGVLEMMAGTFTPQALSLQALDICSTGLALDNENGHLFVSSCEGFTQSYVAGHSKLRLTFSESFPAENLAFGTYKNVNTVFLPDYNDGSVHFYGEGGGQTFSFNTASTSITGIAFKRAGL